MFTKYLLNRKNLPAGAALFLILCGANVFAVKAAQTPEQAVEQFYKWYLRELNTEGGNPIDRKRTINKSVTKRLSKQIYALIAGEEYDADYFIDAQDFNENWAATVSKAAIKGNAATVKVLLSAPKGKKSSFKQNLTIKLIKENGAWKIDRVNDN